MIIKVLSKYYSDCQWSLNGNSYDGITWLDKIKEKPTKEDIEEYLQALQYEEESLAYQQARKSAYPSIEDQLDMLYHLGYDGWKKEIEAVKIAFPKE